MGLLLVLVVAATRVQTTGDRRGRHRGAARACAKALVGRGEATVELAFPENAPRSLSTRLLVFNAGERSGVTKLLVHAFISIPVPTALLSVVTVSRQGSWLRTTFEIPVIVEGYGSLLDFKFRLGKTCSYKGRNTATSKPTARMASSKPT